MDISNKGSVFNINFPNLIEFEIAYYKTNTTKLQTNPCLDLKNIKTIYI